MLSLLLVAATIFSLNLEPKLETGSLTALTVRQTKGVEFFAPRGAPRAHIASFVFETNPDPETSVDLEILDVEIREPNLVLRDIEMEVDGFYQFKTDVFPLLVDGAQKVRFYRRPQDKHRFPGGKKFYGNIFATIDKSSREGTYTIPVRLTGWSAKDRGMGIPFPGVVNGQPLVVVP
jgi:hypothetical protein